MRKSGNALWARVFCGELVMGGFMVMLNTQGIEISEILFNPPGRDTGKEYIELRGQPDEIVSEGTYLLGIEGDTAMGDIQTIVDLSGRQMGRNGMLLLLQSDHPYSSLPSEASVVESGEGGFRGIMGFEADSGGNIENAAVTFLLVETPLKPSLDLDLDETNDGRLDHAITESWTLHDAVSVLKSGGGGVAYAETVFGDPSAFASVPSSVVFYDSGESTYGYVGRYRLENDQETWLGALINGIPNNYLLEEGFYSPDAVRSPRIDHLGVANPEFAIAGASDASAPASTSTLTSAIKLTSRRVGPRVHVQLQGEPGALFKLYGSADFERWDSVQEDELDSDGLYEVPFQPLGGSQFFRVQ